MINITYNFCDDSLRKINRKTQNGLSTMCIWNILQYDDEHVGKEPDGYIKQMYPYLDYLILMVFTGGRDYNNWYSEDENGNPVYDFSKPVEILKNVLRGGVKPFIVMGQTPYDLSSHPEDKGKPGTLWGNRYAPKDWNKYYDYIQAFAKVLVDTFGKEEIRTWKFRLMTEWNDFEASGFWWMEGLEEYLKLYDYTVEALSSEIGADNLFFGPGNVLRANKLERLEDALKHFAYGTNYYTGKTGTKCDHISASIYFDQLDTSWMAEGIKNMKELAERYPVLNINEVGFGEAGFIFDKDKQRLHMAQGITEEFGSAVAQIFDITNQTENTYFANWEYITDRCNYDIDLEHKPCLKTPAANVAELCYRLSGSQMLLPVLEGAAGNNNIVGSFAALCEAGIPEQEAVHAGKGALQVVLYNHNGKMGDNGSEKIQLHINGLNFSQNKEVKVRQWEVSEDSGNFSRQWLIDSLDIVRNDIQFDLGTHGNSRYDTCISLYLDDEGKSFYSNKKKEYRKLSEITAVKTETEINSDGCIDMQLELKHHTVLMLEFLLTGK